MTIEKSRIVKTTFSGLVKQHKKTLVHIMYTETVYLGDRMSFFQNFPIKNDEEVFRILEETDHHQVIGEIIQTGSGYCTRRHINEFGPLQTYNFAIACALASLGNYSAAESICPLPERFVEPGWGDNKSRDLVNKFMIVQS